MANQNYVLIERIELNQTASSVTFSNIPQTGYTDLKIVMSTRAADSANNWYLTKIQFNTDTTSGNYSARFVGGFGSTAYSSTSSNYAGYIPSGARTANTFGNNEIYIPNYAGSTAKSYSTDSVTEGNGSSYEILGLWAGLWSGTAAINQIVLSPDTGSWAQYSTFSLYGIANASTTPAIAPKADGGNVIATDGTYWYHTFLSNGTFTPQVGLTCDYLVIAGGASGANDAGGGGAAGGARCTVGATGGGGSLESPLSLTASTNYTVTIGAGGAGVNNPVSAGGALNGIAGSNSTFATITSTGGGYGGARDVGNVGGPGGSGGGGGGRYGSYSGGAASPSGQGYAGGNGLSGGGGGGGGGAGSAGQTSTGAGGNGGSGLTTSISGTSTTYAGGGGGGGSSTGGTGQAGGGNGGTNNANNATSATANTGSGGGAFYYSASGTTGAGGSGIVIIRYPVA